MERIRRVSGGTYPLSIAAGDDDGEAVTVDSPAVALYDGSGAELATEGAPAAAEGRLAYTVAAGVLGALDTYVAVWSGTVSGSPWERRQELELCGGHLFEISDLRAFDPAFADAVRYPAAVVRAARTAAEQRLEQACRVAFTPRGRRLRAVGAGLARLEVPDNAVRSLLSASVGGTDLTPAELAAVTVREWGAFDRPAGYLWPLGSALALHYEHGQDSPPAPVAQAAMLLAREYLVRSVLSSRATVEATDVGFFRVSVAGPDRPTGLPEVDAVIARFGRSRPTVG